MSNSLAVLSMLALGLCFPPRAYGQASVIIVVPADEGPPLMQVLPAIDVAPESPPEVADPPPASAPEPVGDVTPAVQGPEMFAIGLSGVVGLRDDGRDELAPTWHAGLDLGFRILPWLALGVRRTTFAHAETLVGDRFAIGASPMLELTLPLFAVVQPYAQVGSAMQVRFGGAQGRVVGVAPFLGGGVRFFPADIFSIAIEVLGHVPVTDAGFLFGHEVMPQAAIVLQSGLALAFHVH